MEDADVACDVQSEKLLALDEALSRLAEQQPEKAELVKLRYFAPNLVVLSAGNCYVYRKSDYL